jgi:hypothetical protein
MSPLHTQRLSNTALKLDGIPKVKVLVLCRHYLDSMTGNPFFPNPSPSLAEIAAQLSKAEAAYMESMSKARGKANAADTEIRILRMGLIALAGYVESIANRRPDDADFIIISAGMGVKKTAAKPPRIFSVRLGPYLGSAKLDQKAEKGCYCVYEMSTDPQLNEKNWVRIYQGSRVRFLMRGLESGKQYFFRGMILPKNGIGIWGPVLSVIIQ